MVEDVGVTTSESPLHGSERGDNMGDDNILPLGPHL